MNWKSTCNTMIKIIILMVLARYIQNFAKKVHHIISETAENFKETFSTKNLV